MFYLLCFESSASNVFFISFQAIKYSFAPQFNFDFEGDSFLKLEKKITKKKKRISLDYTKAKSEETVSIAQME